MKITGAESLRRRAGDSALRLDAMRSLPRTPAAHRIAALSIAVIALFGLSACTGAPAPSSSAGADQAPDAAGDGGQSKQDACALLQQSLEDVTAEFEAVSSASDPAAAVAAMTAASATLADLSTQVTNDEVAAILPSLQETFGEAFSVMEAILQGDASKIEDLSALGEKFQDSTQAFQEVCAP